MIRALMIMTLTAFSLPAAACAGPAVESGKRVQSGREPTRSFKTAGLTGKGAVELNASHWQRRARKAMPLSAKNDSE